MKEPFEIWNEDCIPGMARLDPDSIDIVVTSIPFGKLFCYSGKDEDLGNNNDGIDMRHSMFGLHLRFFTEQLFRVVKPGRRVGVHIQQLLRFQNEHGHQGRRDFRATVIDIFEQAGFQWRSEFVIPKNPQVIAQRLKLHSLLFITGQADSLALDPAVNDYVLNFRKPGEAAQPVRGLIHRKKNPAGQFTASEWIRWARGSWEELVTRFNEDETLLEGYPEAVEIIGKLEAEFALLTGVWGDIQEGDVLKNYALGKDAKDQKHVCPLQLAVIDRFLRLYSNPGETVLDPFSGIGSTGHQALKLGRLYRGFELKETYHGVSIRNCRNAIAEGESQQSLDLGGHD